VLKLKGDREQLGLLVRDAEQARRAYDSAAQRRSQTRMEISAGRPQATVVDTATPPLRPRFPNVPLNLAIGVLAGALLGIGLALFAESANRYIRSERDVIDSLGFGPLAVLPGAPRLPRARLALGAPNVRALPKR
jgi:uncharacterized protein involved in exopolysaccharide biosynthesis